MLIASGEKEIMLMKQTKNGMVASKQQENREVGFRHYMQDHYPKIKILELDLPLDDSKEDYDNTLESFLRHTQAFTIVLHFVQKGTSLENFC